jgi:hypothetical protein
MSGTKTWHYFLIIVSSIKQRDFGILPGTYDITITSPHFLINVKRKFGLLTKTYGKQRGQEGFDERADFDRNDKINITDFGLLAANCGKYSPIEVH